MQFSGFKNVNGAVQLSPLFHSGIFSSPPKETPHPLTVTVHLPLPPPLWPQPLATASLISVSMDFRVLDISPKCNPTVGLGVWLLPLSIMFSRFIRIVARVKNKENLIGDGVGNIRSRRKEGFSLSSNCLSGHLHIFSWLPSGWAPGYSPADD